VSLSASLDRLVSSVVWLVLRDVAMVTALGLSIGAVSGLLSGRLVRVLLFGLEPSDATTWALAIGVLALAAGLAGYLPARRAARVDPMVALREE
jgi:ABC-type antimicrobial peptide transport system permease subunit